MSFFKNEDLLLTNKLARCLYHDIARELPIIDYHCHLDPHVLADNKRFANIAELWVTSDPYKHRAMRIAGVPEAEITGCASDRSKFDRWASTLPITLGNPLYVWSALELKRFFGIDERLSPATADGIWERANAKLGDASHSARGLLENRNLECVCTSDRLLDDLQPHYVLASSGWPVRVIPSLRADDITAVETPGYSGWVGELCGKTSDYLSFCGAVITRLDAFHAKGCRLADHALDSFNYIPVGDGETAMLFSRRLRGAFLTDDELMRLRSGLLRFVGAEYARRGWILQLHIGAQRQTSSRLRGLAGPAGGYAGIGSAANIPALCAFLDDLEKAGGLPRTILYPLNPSDNAALATLTGSYAFDGVAGLVQFGPAWWFNDHAHGIREHLEALSSFGLLATFVGMTTDSRSLVSLVRHEYFRRVLCDWIGEQAAKGTFTDDLEELTTLLRAVCHDNAARMLALHPAPL